MAAIPEEQWFLLSAISHWSFCPRRCALVHEEQIWAENFFTTSGKTLHENVDAGGTESRKERRIARSLRLSSAELGVTGIADVVEFLRDDERGVSVGTWTGRWLPHPVEYKWGTAQNEVPYERQLCAQAICLEEMFHTPIAQGDLYLGATKRRRPVVLDKRLREDTRRACVAIRALFESGLTPQAEFLPRCKSCSLVEQCVPKLARRSARSWLARQIDQSLEVEESLP